MNKKIIIANWKMLPETWAEAEQILDSLNEYLGEQGERAESSIVICPPFVFIEEVGKVFGTTSLGQYLSLGAQDIATSDSVVVTGEIPGPMLQGLGVRYVIIGHSERRWKIGESDEIVNRKLKTALENGFIPVVCIGEKERDENFKKFLEDQLCGTFDGLSAGDLQKCLIAYEPVWAISTNPGAKPDTPESALESVKTIEKVLSSTFQVPRPTFLYGGSVNSSNARQFLEEFDGVLVGSASVKKEEFIKILISLK